MSRNEREFAARPEWEQNWFVENTWCDVCNAADIGLIDPAEYEEDGSVFVEGKCRQCGNRVVSEIIEHWR